MPIILPKEFFQDVYDVLEENVEASHWEREDFVDYFINNRGNEFYFCSNLGPGGAFNNQGGRIYLSCNPEDKTDEIYSTIENVNEILEEMLVDYMTNFKRKKKDG